MHKRTWSWSGPFLQILCRNPRFLIGHCIDLIKNMCIVSTFKQFYWFWVTFMIIIMNNIYVFQISNCDDTAMIFAVLKNYFCLSSFLFFIYIYISNLMFNIELSRITVWFVKRNTFCFCFVYLFDNNIRRTQRPRIWKVKHVTTIHSNFNFANTFWYCQY